MVAVEYFSILLLRLAETLEYFFLDQIFSGDALASVTCTKPSTVSPGGHFRNTCCGHS